MNIKCVIIMSLTPGIHQKKGKSQKTVSAKLTLIICNFQKKNPVIHTSSSSLSADEKVSIILMPIYPYAAKVS